jgi:hypothetical protein
MLLPGVRMMRRRKIRSWDDEYRRVSVGEYGFARRTEQSRRLAQPAATDHDECTPLTFGDPHDRLGRVTSLDDLLDRHVCHAIKPTAHPLNQADRVGPWPVAAAFEQTNGVDGDHAPPQRGGQPHRPLERGLGLQGPVDADDHAGLISHRQRRYPRRAAPQRPAGFPPQIVLGEPARRSGVPARDRPSPARERASTTGQAHRRHVRRLHRHVRARPGVNDRRLREVGQVSACHRGRRAARPVTERRLDGPLRSRS